MAHYFSGHLQWQRDRGSKNREGRAWDVMTQLVPIFLFFPPFFFSLNKKRLRWGMSDIRGWNASALPCSFLCLKGAVCNTDYTCFFFHLSTKKGIINRMKNKTWQDWNEMSLSCFQQYLHPLNVSFLFLISILITRFLENGHHQTKPNTLH